MKKLRLLVGDRVLERRGRVGGPQTYTLARAIPQGDEKFIEEARASASIGAACEVADGRGSLQQQSSSCWRPVVVVDEAMGQRLMCRIGEGTQATRLNDGTLVWRLVRQVGHEACRLRLPTS